MNATPSRTRLDWPPETAARNEEAFAWLHAGSNICLDFHGDPVRARLAVFSDGNHHMALQQCVSGFLARRPAAQDVFYATTPPGVLFEAMRSGRLMLGNLCLPARPHVFIGPAPLLDKAHRQGQLEVPAPFARSRGSVFLVRKGNPLGILAPADLLRAEVRTFMSNPVSETASYDVYVETLANLANTHEREALNRLFAPDSSRAVFGERIHHRELPQAIADGRADVAVAYYHLALRYTRIFPQVFDWVAIDGHAPADDPPAGMVVTDYAIAPLADPGEHGLAFVDFMLGGDAARIYESHGLRGLAAAGG